MERRVIETPAFFELLKAHKKAAVFMATNTIRKCKGVVQIPCMWDSHIGGSWERLTRVSCC